MENLVDKDAQSLMLAVAFGGVVVLGAMRFFSNISNPFGATNKSKKKKPKARKKKTKGGETSEQTSRSSVEVEEIVKPVEYPAPALSKLVEPKKESISSATPTEATVSDATGERVETVDCLPADGEASAKKKRKKRRKNKEASELKDPVFVTSAVDEATLPETKNDEVAVDSDAKSEDGWERVPVKFHSRKSAVETAVVFDSGKGKVKENKKEIRKSVEIGEFKPLVIGEGGSTIANIQNVSGAKLQVVSLTKDTNSHTCIVIGDETEVAVATEMINSLLSNQSKAEIILTSRLDKAIIAKSDTMQNIRQISGAKLEFQFGDPKAKEEHLRVLISGETTKVEKAKQLINDYLTGKTPDGNEGVKRLQVNNFQARLLIGRKGEKIAQLQKASGTGINVEFTESEAYAVVSVIGNEDQIAKGVDLIREFLSEHNFSEEIELDSDARGVFQKFNDIRKEIPNLKLDVSEDRSKVTFTGSIAGVNQGKEILAQLIADELGPPKIKSDELLVSIDLGSAAGKVIGRNRATLKALEQTSGPGAKVVIKQGTVCYVYGHPSSVKRLSSDIEAIVIRHNEQLTKSQKEEEHLQQGVWEVVNEEPEKQTMATRFGAQSHGQAGSLNSSAVVEEDWGGFRLAQMQGW